MRTTIRIEDDLLLTLKDQAHREGVRLTELVNRVIRRGLDASGNSSGKPAKTYREQTFRMGAPAVDLSKALALATSLEDEEALEKLIRRK